MMSYHNLFVIARTEKFFTVSTLGARNIKNFEDALSYPYLYSYIIRDTLSKIIFLLPVFPAVDTGKTHNLKA